MKAVVLAGHRFSSPLGDGQIDCRPVFTARYQTSGGGGWPRQALFAMASWLPAALAGSVAPPIRELRRQIRRAGTPEDPFGPELRAALSDLGGSSNDLLVLHSVSAANLASLPDAVPPEMVGTILVVLRRTPEDMDADDPAKQPTSALLRHLGCVYGGKLLLYADTNDLAALFQAACGLTVRPVPPPVSVPIEIARDRPVGEKPHLLFIGGARLEKNYHRLPAIVAACRGRARFTFHSGPVDAASDPLLQRAHREAQALSGPDLTLIERALSPSEYWTLLADADLVLLNYDAAAYGPRSSGILVEALAIGVPAVVPAGCWMEHAGGPSRTIVMANAEEAPVAVDRALRSLTRLTSAAVAGRDAWRRMHSAESLLDALLNPVAFPVAI
jgi:glycosyltransferase involved in cell wall biosynthesis